MEELMLLKSTFIKDFIHLTNNSDIVVSDAVIIAEFKQALRIQAKVQQVKKELIDDL